MNRRRSLGSLPVAQVALALAALVCAPSSTGAQQKPAPAAVEYDEQLGNFVPADITLVDEQGRTVRLGDLIDRPTILSLVYFECPGICTPLLNEVADVLGKTSLDPADQPFQLLTVSFDPGDTPTLAASKRDNYYALLRRPLPRKIWRFLTGDAENIRRLTDAVGFRYKSAGEEYVHPGGLIILSPKRKVVRYLYGTSFLPFDFQMGVIEAAKGTVSPTTARLLRFCFSYDPEGRTYVFNLARVVGSVMLISIVFFGGFLYFSTRRIRPTRATKG